jgi:hypothetical protein
VVVVVFVVEVADVEAATGVEPLVASRLH